MADFYSAWLANSERIEKAVGEAPRVARGKELNWIRTRQDHKAALMIAPETGFPTGGSLLMKAKIPIGCHTGKHVHGEEAIYIERGQGFLLLDGERFDFQKGTIFHIPYRASHQLFNTDNEPVVYISGLAWPLEAAIYMGRMAMHEKQFELSDETKHGATYYLMGIHGDRNGFKVKAVRISSIFVDLPHSKSHSHAHPEAYLYALEGSGYSEIDGKRYEWVQGDAIHVPPGMLHHQHFNPYDTEMRELRFEFGIRYWFVDQWKGYTTIDRHMHATHLDD